MSPRPDHAAHLRREVTDVSSVIAALGLGGGAKRQAGGVLVRCPWHEEKTPSCSVTLGPDGTIRVRCFGCDASGDVLSLVAQVHGLDTKRSFVEVMRITAEQFGLWSVAIELARESQGARRPPSTPPVMRASSPPEPPRVYPPIEEVRALWSSGLACADDADVSAYLAGRHIDPVSVDEFGLARALPLGVWLPRWARYQGKTWTQTGHRLVLPMFDELGVMRSLRAARIVDGDSPKRLPPSGHKAAGLVMADGPARLVLERGTAPEGVPLRIVVLEGEPDFLTWTSRVNDASEQTTAFFGIVASGWSDKIAARIPNGARVVVRTHHDDAGNKYATQIYATLTGRCRLARSKE